MRSITTLAVLGCAVLASAATAGAACTTASEAKLVLKSAKQLAQCNDRILKSGPGVSCKLTPPPACAGSLVADTLAAAYGANNPPSAAVNRVLLKDQLNCQRQIGKAAAYFVGLKLKYLIQGLSDAEATAKARKHLDKIPDRCEVSVAEDPASSIDLPAVGEQLGAAVGAPGSEVDAAALADALVTLLGTWVDRVRPSPTPPRPNVIVLLTDDQRADTSTATWMPKLNAELVASGVSLPNGIATNPVCCPSRSTILSGQYAHTHGVFTNNAGNGTEPTGSIRAFSDVSTLATWLQSAGYRTGMFGKYLNGYKQFSDDYAASHGGVHYVPPGWDRWLAVYGGKFWGVKYIDESGNQVNTDPGTCNDEPPGEACPTSQPPECPYHTDQLRDEALDFIDEAVAMDQPFFLYWSTKAPHGPACPALRHQGMFNGIPPHRPPSYDEGAPGADPDDDKPAWLQQQGPIDAAEIDDFRIRQLESLQAVDEAVEAFMVKLRDEGLDENTIVVFLGDNGYLWGEHRRSKKSCPYEECLKVPFYVRYPKLAPLPRTEPGSAGNIDLAPTFAELAGVNPIPLAPIDGESLVRLLDGTDGAWRPDILGEHWGRAPGPNDPTPNIPTFALVRDGEWKYTEYCTGERELYDLGADPFELSNVIDDHPDRASAMAVRLREIDSWWPASIPFDCGSWLDDEEDED